MFDVNLLNKQGLQSKSGVEQEDEPGNDKVKISLNSENETMSDSSGYYYLVLIILMLFVYIYYFNQSIFDENYKNVYPAHILSVLEINDVSDNVHSMKIHGDSFSILNRYNVSDLSYNHQAYFDSLFSTKTFLSIDDIGNNLFLEFNWYILEDSSWSISDLYEKIISEKSFSLKTDFLNNKIISVADYNELILLFNMLSSLEIEHIFKYHIELFDDALESKEKYYKIIISEYD